MNHNIYSIDISISQILIVFIFLLCILFYITSCSKDSQKNLFKSKILYLLIFILIITRSDTMADYQSYVIDLKDKYYSLGQEPFFNIIKYLSQNIFSSYYGAFAIYAIISLTLRYNYIKHYPTIILSCILVYVSNLLVLQDMIAIRSAIAACLLLYLVDAKKNYKYKRYFIIILIAICFHYSAIIFFIILGLSNQKVHKRIYISLLIISYILTLSGFAFASILGKTLNSLNLGVIALHFNNYSDEHLNIFNLLQIGHIIICLYAWIKINKIITKYPNSLLFLKIYTLALCLLPLFSDLISVGIRLSELFLSVEIILVPMIFTSTIKKVSTQKIILILYSIIIFTFTVFNSQYWNPEII